MLCLPVCGSEGQMCVCVCVLATCMSMSSNGTLCLCLELDEMCCCEMNRHIHSRKLNGTLCLEWNLVFLNGTLSSNWMKSVS